jgi:hypothetical protein
VTGLCVGERCREPCGSTEDCPRSPRLVDPSCTFARARSSAGRDDFVPVCSYSSSGSGARAAACTSDNDCRDRTCVDATGDPFPPEGTERFCADACCNDADCAGGEQCRPTFVHGHWEMHCLPKPMFAPVGGGV